jgi:hypothetical protein
MFYEEQDRAVAGEISLAEIAAAFFASLHTKERDDDPNFWAIDLWFPVNDEWWQDEERVRSGLLALIDAASGDDDLAYVGAGPLEDFIENDESRLRWIEGQARTSARFRRALSNVWVWGMQRNEVAERVERAAGVPLARPKWGRSD